MAPSGGMACGDVCAVCLQLTSTRGRLDSAAVDAPAAVPPSGPAPEVNVTITDLTACTDVLFPDRISDWAVLKASPAQCCVEHF